MRRTFSAHGDRACSPPKYLCIGCSSPGVVKVGKWKGNWPAWAIALILTCLVGFRTSTRAEPPRPLVSSVYRLRTWSTADGLPENSATAVTQTQDGYLWIGSWNGLVRYSGDRFALFDPANTPGLPAAGIVNLHADRWGRLWVSTLAGLVVKDGTYWRPLDTHEGWPGSPVRTFAERPNGDLQLRTFDGHVLAVADNRLPGRRTTTVSGISRGRLWRSRCCRVTGKRAGSACSWDSCSLGWAGRRPGPGPAGTWRVPSSGSAWPTNCKRCGRSWPTRAA